MNYATLMQNMENTKRELAQETYKVVEKLFGLIEDAILNNSYADTSDVDLNLGINQLENKYS